MAKRLIRYISIRDTDTGKVLSKNHRSLMAASSKARAIAKKTGRATQVNDEFGVYLKYPGRVANPKSAIPSSWTTAKVRVVRGRVHIQLPRRRR